VDKEVEVEGKEVVIVVVVNGGWFSFKEQVWVGGFGFFIFFFVNVGHCVLSLKVQKYK
jgi:hypothetical protein